MAIITSSASGNWSVGATWVGGIAPVLGDSVIIARTGSATNLFSTDATGYAIGATAITLTGTVLAGSFVIGESVQFGTDPNYYAITGWVVATKVLTVAPLLIAIPAVATIVTNSGHIVTVDTTGLVGGDDTATAIVVNGTLKASRIADNNLRVRGHLIFNSGSTIDFGKSIDAIPVAYHATLFLNDSAALAVGKWGMRVLDGANAYFYGAVKTINTVSTNAVAVGATTMDVANGVGWEIGDTLIFQATDGTWNHDDVRTISTITLISGTAYTVTFAATTYAHALGAKIGNMTSNVTINAYNSSYAHLSTFQHNTVSIAGTREVQYTAFWNRQDNTAATTDLFNGNSRTTAVWTNFKNNILYNNNTLSSYSVQFFAFPAGLTVSGCAFYNNAPQIQQGTYINFTSCVFYKSASSVIASSYSQGGVGCVFSFCDFLAAGSFCNFSPAIGFTFNDCTFHTVQSYGFSLVAGLTQTFNRCSISSSDLVGTPTIPYFTAHSVNSLCPVVFNDCKFKSGGVFNTNITLANPAHSIVVANKDVDPSAQEIYKSAGIIIRDNTSKVSGVTSLKMSPISATLPLTFTMLIPAPTGKKVGVSGYLWRDTANVATVTLSGLGITPSVYTASGALSANEQFFVSGTQSSGTDGFLTLTISTIGATGNMWVDGISAPQSAAIDFGEFGYWSGGLPADIVTASYVSAGDVWNYLTANISVAGSIGSQLKNYAKNVLRIG